MAEQTNIEVQETEKQELAESGAERTRARAAFVPRVDIYEADDHIAVVADMPGVTPDALDVTLEQNVLTINGNVDPEAPEGYDLAYAEYRVGDYVRSFRITNEIDADNIEATLKDGVLHLHLPKVEPSTKKIAIKAS
jgi:HSP20 family molecular chaperone IbpA